MGGLRPLGTPVGPVRGVKITMASVVESTERAVRGVKITMASVVESTERALSEVEQREAHRGYLTTAMVTDSSADAHKCSCVPAFPVIP
jgi:hypothetical protein